MNRISPRLLGFFIVLVTLIPVSFFAATHGKSNPGLLVVSHGDFVANGGPISIINIETGDVTRPPIEGLGCDGMSEDFTASGIHIYCKVAGYTHNFWHIDSVRGNVESQTPVSEGQMMPDASVHTRIIIGRDGTQYYTTGGPLPPEEATVLGKGNDAGVLIVRDGVSTAVPISDDQKNLFIFRMVLDEVNGKVWTLSMGDGKTVLIDRVDIATNRVDASTRIESFYGYGLLVDRGRVLVSTYRTAEGNDLFVFDAQSLTQIKAFPLPVTNVEGFNALDMVVYRGDVLIGSTGGLFKLSRETYEVKDFVSNNPESRFTRLVTAGNRLYAIRDFERVVEIDGSTLEITRELLDATGQGLANLLFVPLTHMGGV